MLAPQKPDPQARQRENGIRNRKSLTIRLIPKKKTAIVLHRKTQNSKTNGKPHLVLANAISRERTGESTSAKREKGRKEEMDDGYASELVLHV